MASGNKKPMVTCAWCGKKRIKNINQHLRWCDKYIDMEKEKPVKTKPVQKVSAKEAILEDKAYELQDTVNDLQTRLQVEKDYNVEVGYATALVLNQLRLVAERIGFEDIDDQIDFVKAVSQALINKVNKSEVLVVNLEDVK